MRQFIRVHTKETLICKIGLKFQQAYRICMLLVSYMVEMSMSLKCSSQPSWAATSLNSSVILIRPKSRLNSAGNVTIQYLNTHTDIYYLAAIWHWNFWDMIYACACNFSSQILSTEPDNDLCDLVSRVHLLCRKFPTACFTSTTVWCPHPLVQGSINP